MPKRSIGERSARSMRLAADALGRGEGEPHEEAAGLAVPELVALGDVGAERRKLGRHRGDDAGPVRAGQREDEGLLAHGRGS